jgi:hypothetical protein
MASRNQNNQRIQDEMGFLWPLLLVLLGSVALPALLLGMLIQRLIGIRPWSFPLWLVLTGGGAVLVYVLYTHGLDRLLLAQFATYVQTVKIHQADISQWNIGLLWSKTWPVWLRTLILTPIVAFWREIEAQMHGERATSLEKQERQRQQRIARSKKQAARRARHPEHLPEEQNDEMVIGVTIDDKYAE